MPTGNRLFGAHTFGFVWRSNVADTVAVLAGSGFRCFQLLASPPHLDAFHPSDGVLATLSAAVASCDGMLLSLDPPAGEFNLASPIRDAAQFGIQKYRELVDVAAVLGSRYVTVTSGRKHGLLPAPAGVLERIFTDSFAELASHAKSRGVRLLLENHPLGVLSRAAEMLQFLEQNGFDGADLLYDVANAAAIGETPEVGLRVVERRLGAVHVSDTPRGSWRHDPIGTGSIDFEAIASALRQTGFAGPVVAEIISPAPLADLLDARTRLLPLLEGYS